MVTFTGDIIHVRRVFEILATREVCFQSINQSLFQAQGPYDTQTHTTE